MVRLNNDEQNASEPRVASAGGPPTLPPVGRQWPAGLMLSGSTVITDVNTGTMCGRLADKNRVNNVLCID